MTNIAKGIIIGAIAVFGALWLYGTGINQGVKQVTTAPALTPVAPNNTDTLEVQWKAGFMSSCNKNGTLYNYCTCAWDYLRARNSLADIAQMGNEYTRTGYFPEGMKSAINACAYQANPDSGNTYQQ